MGLIFGAGIYALIGEAAGIAGNALWMSFLIAAIVSSFTAFSYAELSSIFPRSAAEFVYVKKATRSGFIAFFIGYITVLSAIISVPAVALGFGGYFNALAGTPIWANALAVIILFSLLNFIGIKESAKYNLFSTIIEAGGLLLIILIGAGYIGSVSYFEMPAGVGSIMQPIFFASALVFFAYLGFEHVANVAEETKDPKHTIPKALLLSFLITTIVYVLVSIVVVSVIPYNELAASSSPLSLVAEKALGSQAGIMLSIIALFATSNTVLILLIVVSRMIFGMAEEGSLPKILTSIHPKTKTPYYAIIAVALLSIAFLGVGEIGTVALLSNFGIFITFFAVNISNVIMRFTHTAARRTFRAPLNIGRVPILSLLGAISCIFMLLQITQTITIFGFEAPILLFGIVLSLTAVPVYFLFSKNAGK